MAEYVNWGLFFAGFVIGGICVYSICEFIFPISEKDE
jgi:hypothetical protein